MPKKLHPFYKKMLDAKAAKKTVVKKEKGKKQEAFLKPPKVKSITPPSSAKKEMQRIEVTAPIIAKQQDIMSGTKSAMEAALARIEQQAQGL